MFVLKTIFWKHNSNKIYMCSEGHIVDHFIKFFKQPGYVSFQCHRRVTWVVFNKVPPNLHLWCYIKYSSSYFYNKNPDFYIKSKNRLCTRKLTGGNWSWRGRFVAFQHATLWRVVILTPSLLGYNVCVCEKRKNRRENREERHTNLFLGLFPSRWRCLNFL